MEVIQACDDAEEHEQNESIPSQQGQPLLKLNESSNHSSSHSRSESPDSARRQSGSESILKSSYHEENQSCSPLHFRIRSSSPNEQSVHNRSKYADNNCKETRPTSSALISEEMTLDDLEMMKLMGFSSFESTKKPFELNLGLDDDESQPFRGRFERQGGGGHDRWNNSGDKGGRFGDEDYRRNFDDRGRNLRDNGGRDSDRRDRRRDDREDCYRDRGIESRRDSQDRFDDYIGRRRDDNHYRGGTNNPERETREYRNDRSLKSDRRRDCRIDDRKYSEQTKFGADSNSDNRFDYRQHY